MDAMARRTILVVGVLLWAAGCEDDGPRAGTIELCFEADPEKAQVLDKYFKEHPFIVEPDKDVEYTIKIVKPDANIGYAIRRVLPDPRIEYTIRRVYPNAGREGTTDWEGKVDQLRRAIEEGIRKALQKQRAKEKK